MIKEFEIENDKVLITMVLPFLNIPSIDQLTGGIKELIEKLYLGS